MTFSSRLALAIFVLVVDFATIAVPLCAILAAYVIVARPARFLYWVLRLYDDDHVPAGG